MRIKKFIVVIAHCPVHAFREYEFRFCMRSTIQLYYSSLVITSSAQSRKGSRKGSPVIHTGRLERDLRSQLKGSPFDHCALGGRCARGKREHSASHLEAAIRDVIGRRVPV